MRMGSFRLLCKQHLDDPKTLEATRNITSGGTHHHPRHDWRCDATCSAQPEDVDHSPARGQSRTGRQIRYASHSNTGIQFSTLLTIVSHSTS
jgi:hypothetical protein